MLVKLQVSSWQRRGSPMGLQHPANVAEMIRAAHKDKTHLQFGALVYRVKNKKTQVLLITSRRSHRWIAPKGWPIDGLKPHKVAAQEAWEEAGVRGRVFKDCIGLYEYAKVGKDGKSKHCTVMLFPLKASKLVNAFPARGQRRRKWLTPKKAAARIYIPELAKIMRKFDTRHLR